MQLHEQLETVTDEATYLAFVHALFVDLQSDAEHWNNKSIEDFLQAASGWAEDSEFGSKIGLSSTSPWKEICNLPILREDLRIANSVLPARRRLPALR